MTDAGPPGVARLVLVLYVLVVLVGVLLHLLFENQLVALVGLAVAMPVLAIYLIMAAPIVRLTGLTLVALFFSWLGDAFGYTFLIKLGFFLIAQIVYSVAFWPYRRRAVLRLPWMIAYGVGIAAAIIVVALNAGMLLIPVLVYGLSLGVMAVLANGVNVTAGVGGFLFLVSDIVLAVAIFVAPGLIPNVDALNSVLYLPGQGMIVLGVVHRVLAERSAPPV